MLVDIKSINHSIGAVLTLETQISPVELSSTLQDYRLTRPLFFQGTLQNCGEGILELSGRIRTTYAGECARCLAPVEVEADLTLSELFQKPASEGSNEDDDRYRYTGTVLDIGQAILDNLILAMPPRLYCREDCRGLCPVCGGNLNEYDCGHAEERSKFNSSFDQLKKLL